MALEPIPALAPTPRIAGNQQHLKSLDFLQFTALLKGQVQNSDSAMLCVRVGMRQLLGPLAYFHGMCNGRYNITRHPGSARLNLKRRAGTSENTQTLTGN
jgi:hypothetical protein